MSDRPKVSFGKVTRGGGKVFVLVRTRGASRLAVSSKGSDGRELPASAVRLARDEWVAYVAVLDCAQVLTAHALDEGGRVLLSKQKTVGALGARISSSINTLRKDAVAEKIRNADRKLGGSGMRIILEELLADESDEILRGTIEFFAQDERAASLPIDVTVISGRGDCACQACASLDDALCVEGDLPRTMLRRLRFSCRVGGGLDSLVVWARVEGAPEWDAFETIEPFEADALRARTAPRYLSAAETDEYERRVALDALELPARLEQMRALVSAMPERPSFSIVVPVFNTPLGFLGEMIDSVLAQAYPDFELLLVNASPDNGDLSRALDEALARDDRVRRCDLEGNLGITENTNVGIRAATGDFVCFLDHDDTIEPDALWWYARAVCEHPDADLIYCDEDHLLDGRRIGPYFKPDWDPDLLCSENYVCHMLCVRREVAMSAGELPGSEFDGSQDHNMTFLVGERARSVCHVPRVLYHWRMHEGSTAGSEGVGQKSYALEAERRAVQAHLDRVGISAEAVMERRREMRCDLVYRIPENTRVSVAIAHEPGNPNLLGCVGALAGGTDRQGLEVVVAGELSAEEVARLSDACGSSHALVHVPTGPVVRSPGVGDATADGALGVPAALNRAIERATGEYVLLLDENACAFGGPDWLDEMVGPLACGDAACVGAKATRADGSIACAGYLVGAGHLLARAYEGYPARATGYYEYNVLPHRATAVSGACLMARRSDLAGGLDEDLPTTFDVALCLRLARAGGAVLQQNNASVTLADAPMRRTSAGGRAEGARELALLANRFRDELARSDPYYTPNVARGNVFFGYVEGASRR